MGIKTQGLIKYDAQKHWIGILRNRFPEIMKPFPIFRKEIIAAF